MYILFSSISLLVLATCLSVLHSTSAERTTFPSAFATCANAKAGLAPVTVQPNCDSALSTVCKTVVALIANASTPTNYKATGNTIIGGCQASILFAPAPTNLSTYTYHTCVRHFQSITIDCMLIGIGKFAGAGHQAGVKGVVFDNETGFSALDSSRPGYLVGPPEYYGDIGAVDLTAHVIGNLRPPSCRDENGTRKCDFAPAPSGLQAAIHAQFAQATPKPG